MNEPAAWEPTLKFFDYLDNHSTKEDSKKIYTGSITAAYKNLGISQSMYSEVVGMLLNLGCILYVQKGGRSKPSIVEVVKTPEYEEWLAQRLWFLGKGKGLTRSGRLARLEQRLDEVANRQLGGLNIVEALANLENRITKLEEQESNGTAQN